MAPTQANTVFYKGKEADFSVIIEDEDKVNNFRHGDTTLPLIDLVGIYKVFVSRQGGAESIFEEASRQELDTEFGTHKQDEVIIKILKEGEFNTTGNLNTRHSSTNDSKGHNITR
ncbi:restriction of telomere capping protein 3 [Diutina catenulata]